MLLQLVRENKQTLLFADRNMRELSMVSNAESQ
jgi:hypothetical protein